MLQLEYTCTDAERREAQSLSLRQELGKGSRIRTHVMLIGMLALALTAVYFQFRMEVAPRFRLWYLLLFPAAFLFLFFWNRRVRKRPDKPSKFELSEREVTAINDNLRVSTEWSAFGKCLESSNLFVLVDKTKFYLLIFPKRVFPDERAQDWFRTLANQRSNAAASTADLPPVQSVPLPADGVAINFQLGYRDYLNRLLISWRIKGIALAIFLFVTGQCIYMSTQPNPEAVNSPAKVYFVFVLPFLAVMFAIIFPIVALVSWSSERKHLIPRQLVLGTERISFAGSAGTGFMPWTTYTHWLENRWCFVVWKPGSRIWDMFPKRAFASPLEIDRCRELLQQHLRKSRWFFY